MTRFMVKLGSWKVTLEVAHSFRRHPPQAMWHAGVGITIQGNGKYWQYDRLRGEDGFPAWFFLPSADAPEFLPLKL